MMSSSLTITPEQKIGIVLLNMGGPATLEDIRPFLYNLFVDPDLIELPWLLKPFQKLIAWLIAKFRTPSTSKMYEEIGDGSPILPITERLGKKISQYFGQSAEALVAMRYTSPRAVDTVKRLKEQQIDNVVLFSQYPHYACSTSGSSIKEFYKVMEELDYHPQKIYEIDDWGMEPEYIHWWVSGIQQVISEHEINLNHNTHLIFSAHGLPQRYVDRGEQYPQRIRAAAGKIIEDLGGLAKDINTHVSFQSQAGPVLWTKPYTDELLEEIAELEGQRVIIVPLGFVSNHVETLYEIDILYKNQAIETGITEYYRVEVPDMDNNYAKDMVTMIKRRMETQE